MKIQRKVTAAAWSGYRITVLLRAVHPVRKLVIRHYVIELRRWLVEPGTPSFTAVARHNRSLVATENHPPRLIGINPQFVIVVAPGRAFESCKRLPSVARLVSCGVRNIDSVRILGVHAELSEVPPAPPDAPVSRNPLPTLPAVVRTKKPAFLGIQDQINSPRVARRKRDADPSESLRWQSLPAYMFPMVAPITRAIQPAARAVRRSVDAPRRPSRLPQRCVNHFRIAGLESKIDRARVFVLKQNLLPALSSIFRTENAALRVRPISMPHRRHENFVRVTRVHEDSPDLPRILQPHVFPRLAAVSGLVHPIPVRD